MPNIALLVAEAPWFSPKENHTQASCLPFFEGARKLINNQVSDGKLNIYNCTFFDTSSLKQAINHLIQTEEDRQILYLGGHGDGKKIANANLKTAIEHVRQSGDKIKGLIVSSCWGAINNTLSDALGWDVIPTERSIKEIYGPNWVIGYKHPVNWFESALVETAIINSCSSYYINDPKKLNSSEGIISCLTEALLPFDVNNYQFASDLENGYSIKETIRVWIRPQGASYPKEITDLLFDKVESEQFNN